LPTFAVPVITGSAVFLGIVLLATVAVVDAVAVDPVVAVAVTEKLCEPSVSNVVSSVLPSPPA
jgi:hypothetical protein